MRKNLTQLRLADIIEFINQQQCWHTSELFTLNRKLTEPWDFAESDVPVNFCCRFCIFALSFQWFAYIWCNGSMLWIWLHTTVSFWRLFFFLTSFRNVWCRYSFVWILVYYFKLFGYNKNTVFIYFEYLGARWFLRHRCHMPKLPVKTVNFK